jgi:hypothetical protein
VRRRRGSKRREQEAPPATPQPAPARKRRVTAQAPAEAVVWPHQKLKKKKWKARSVTDAQALAIGHFLVNFNLMDRLIEHLIKVIRADPDGGPDKPRRRHRALRTKLTELRRLLDSLPEQEIVAYSQGAAAAGKLIYRIRQLNNFRNHIVHWVYETGFDKVKLDVSASEIEARSSQVHDVALEMMARAMVLTRGESTSD